MELSVNGIEPEIKISGEIFEIGTPRRWKGKDGSEHVATDIVVMCDDQYKTKVAFTLFDEVGVNAMGKRVKVHAYSKSRKYDGRWFTQNTVKFIAYT